MPPSPLEIQKSQKRISDVAIIWVQSENKLITRKKGKVILPSFNIADPYIYAYVPEFDRVYFLALRDEESPTGAENLTDKGFPIQPDTDDPQGHKAIILKSIQK